MELALVAKPRTETGKGAARKLRQQERIPAVCYGPISESVSLTVPLNEFRKLLRQIGFEAKVFPLTVETEGQTERKHVMVRDVQVDPIKRKIMHVDFYEVDMSQPIVVDVPIELTGEPVGVTHGGLLNQIRHTVSVRCLPSDIPEGLQLDVSSLEIGESIHIGELRSLFDLELLDEDHYTVVTVGAPVVEAAAEGEEELEEPGELEEGEEGEEVKEE